MNDDRYVTGFDFASPLGDRQDERTAEETFSDKRRIMDEILSGMSAGLAQASEQVYQHVWRASGAYRDRAAEQAVGYDPPGYPEAPPICRCELDDPVISPDVFEGEFRRLY